MFHGAVLRTVLVISTAHIPTDILVLLVLLFYTVPTYEKFVIQRAENSMEDETQ